MPYEPEAAPCTEPEALQRALTELKLEKPAAEFDAFAAKLGQAFDAPYAMVNIIAGHGQTFVGIYSSNGDLATIGRTMPGNHGFCPHVVERRKALVLPDVMASPRFAGNAVVDSLGIRTYGGAPLIDERSDTVLGTVCFIGHHDRPQDTARHSLDLIKQHRDDLMHLIYQRAGIPPASHS